MDLCIQYDKDKWINLDYLYKTIIERYSTKKNLHNIDFKIDNINYNLNISFGVNYVKMNFKNNPEIFVIKPPLKILFTFKKNEINMNEEKIIFTYAQFLKYISEFHYKNPIIVYNQKEYKIDYLESIRKDDGNIKVIEKMDNSEIIFAQIQKLEKKIYDTVSIKISDVSKYFELYLKESLKTKHFKFYFTESRINFIDKIQSFLKKKPLIFLTGPHGIGKTVSLLSLKLFENKIADKFIYLNLEVFSKSNKDKWIDIFKYECANIFININEFKLIFEDQKIVESNSFYNLLYNFIDLIQKLEYSNNICIILDQYKKSESNQPLLDEIKKQIIQINKIKLIVCSSINDTNVREDLINNLVLKTHVSYNYKYITNILVKITDDNINNDLDNEFKLFSYIPKYINIFEKEKELNFDIIEKKISNHISEKLLKFWKKQSLNEIDSITIILENIGKLLSINDFMKINKCFSFKYFKIYIITKENSKDIQEETGYILEEINKYYDENVLICFCFPFVENILINIKRNSFNNYAIQAINTQNFSSKGNLYKYNLAIFFHNNIGKIIFSGLFEKITSIINIHSPFDILKLKENKKSINNKNQYSVYQNTIKKINNLKIDDVVLFEFDFFSVKRYDFLIYIKKNNSALLIQATNHKDEDALNKYNDTNINKDTKDINKEFKLIYDIDILHFYLVFFINPDFTSLNELKNNYYNKNLDFFLLDYKNVFYEYNIINNNLKKIDKFHIEFKEIGIKAIIDNFKPIIKEEKTNNLLMKIKEINLMGKKVERNKKSSEKEEFLNEGFLRKFKDLFNYNKNISFTYLTEIDYFSPQMEINDNIGVRIKYNNRNSDIIFMNFNKYYKCINLKSCKEEKTLEFPIREYSKNNDYKILVYDIK